VTGRVGYPPCPRLPHFKTLLEEKHGLDVVIGTHPVPEKYFRTHECLGTWPGDAWHALLRDTLGDEETRRAHD
jgi:hypothetical protein